MRTLILILTFAWSLNLTGQEVVPLNVSGLGIVQGTSGLESVLSSIDTGGVALVFWDRWVDDWYAANAIFYPAYNWKVNFLVYGWSGSLTAAQRDTMLVLQNTYGHRIENHGVNGNTLGSYGGDEDAFFDAQVEPNRIAMEAGGVNPVKVFSFSDGQRTTPLCTKIVDSTSHEMTLSIVSGFIDTVENTYPYQRDMFVVGDVTDGVDIKAYLGMGSQQYTFSWDYFRLMLEYCRDNNQVVVFGGHHISESDTTTTLFSTIDSICSFIVDNNMKFYTLAELINTTPADSPPAKPYIRKMRYSYPTHWAVDSLQWGGYNYMDDNERAESGTIFQWYRADDVDGTNEAAIAGATSQGYTFVEADRAKYVRMKVTPKNAVLTGDEATTIWNLIE